MNNAEEELRRFIADNNISAQHLIFGQSCHSVEEAAQAAGATARDFVKNICLLDKTGNLIVAIVKGEDKVSVSKIGKLLNITTPRTAKPDEILAQTGYICGGVPSFGYEAIFLIDERVMEKETVYSGGGSEYSLVRLAPGEMLKANQGRVANIRKD